MASIKNDIFEVEPDINDILDMPKYLFELWENKNQSESEKEKFSRQYKKWKRKYKR